jgi:hypothetical protein
MAITYLCVYYEAKKKWTKFLNKSVYKNFIQTDKNKWVCNLEIATEKLKITSKVLFFIEILKKKPILLWW